MLDGRSEASPEGGRPGGRNAPLPDPAAAVTRPGDLWRLGRHRLLCGDARDAAAYRALSGKSGRPHLHRPALQRADRRPCLLASAGFAIASSPWASAKCPVQPSPPSCSRPWAMPRQLPRRRHRLRLHGLAAYGELLAAGEAVFTELKNLCVWNKTNGGMGSFYRSKHELVFVFKVGTAAAYQHFRSGRYRALSHQRWTYPGVNAFGTGRMDELAMHPTVKPVALVADAIRDCSRRGRHRARSFRRLGHHVDCRREDRPAGPRHRTRSGVLRHHRRPLRAEHRETRPPSGDWSTL